MQSGSDSTQATTSSSMSLPTDVNLTIKTLLQPSFPTIGALQSSNSSSDQPMAMVMPSAVAKKPPLISQEPLLLSKKTLLNIPTNNSTQVFKSQNFVYHYKTIFLVNSEKSISIRLRESRVNIDQTTSSYYIY